MAPKKPTRLPLVVSVPHGGVQVPDELVADCQLSALQLTEDGDTWARELYAFQDRVAHFQVASVARAVLDLNRAPDDRPPANPDGVIKTRTVFGDPVWKNPGGPQADQADAMIARYHLPYHQDLQTACLQPGLGLGLDCHTMLAQSPLLGNNPGQPRPAICISNRGDNRGEEAGETLTAPGEMVRSFRDVLIQAFDLDAADVCINAPFRGGHICRHQAAMGPLPWIQLELNRDLYLPGGRALTVQPDDLARQCLADLRDKLHKALQALCRIQRW